MKRKEFYWVYGITSFNEQFYVRMRFNPLDHKGSAADIRKKINVGAHTKIIITNYKRVSEC